MLFSGIASFTTVSGGGTQNVSGGGLVVSTTLSGGFQILSGGTAIDTTVDSGGIEFMTFYATAVSTTVNNGGSQVVSGGSFYFSSINNFEDLDGGTTSFTTVNSGGVEDVDDLSTAISTTVNNGGVEFLNAEDVGGAEAQPVSPP